MFIFLYHWLILITTKLYMVMIWKVINNVIHDKTYQFWQHWLSLHSLYSTLDFQVRKINMVQFVTTVQCFLQIVYGIVTDHKRRNYNSVKKIVCHAKSWRKSANLAEFHYQFLIVFLVCVRLSRDSSI